VEIASGHRGRLVPSLLEYVPNQCSISLFSSFKTIIFAGEMLKAKEKQVG
jgi:hypothetical protein